MNLPKLKQVLRVQPKGMQARRGTAVMELAIVLPVLLLLLMATIETTSMIFLKQSVKIAAYEAARVALVPSSELENVEAAASEILEVRRVKSFSIAVSPPNFSQQPYGTPIAVSVNADCNANSLFAPWFYGDKAVTGSVTMMKETK